MKEIKPMFSKEEINLDVIDEATNDKFDELAAILKDFSPKRQAEILEHYKNPEKGGKKAKKSPDLLFLESISKEDNIRMKYEDDFYEWQENHWHLITDKQIKRMAHKFLGDESSTGKIDSCEKMVNSQARVLKKTANRSDVIIPLKDCYVSIDDTGALIEMKPDKDLNFCYYINAKYNNFAKGDMFTKFLNTSIPDKEIQDLLQEFVGYSLIQNVNKAKMLFLTGGGGDGKSVFIDLVSALHYHTVAVDPAKLDGFPLANILDATLCVAAETDKKIMEQALKTLVAGDIISVQRKYKTDIAFRNQSRFIFSCNELPHIMDASAGFWRRMFIVPFNNPPKKEDQIEGLAQKIIDKELDYLLTWAMNGLIRLKMNNWNFTEAKAIADKTKDYQVETNSCLNFMSQFEIMETNQPITKTSDIYEDYQYFCTENNLRPFSTKKFWNQLNIEIKNKGIVVEKISKRCNVEINGVVVSKPRPHINIDLVYKCELTDYIKHHKVFLKEGKKIIDNKPTF